MDRYISDNQITVLFKEQFLFVTDVDECSTNSNDCDTNADCTNIDGSFTCTCKSGWDGDGKACTVGKCHRNIT